MSCTASREWHTTEARWGSVVCSLPNYAASHCKTAPLPNRVTSKFIKKAVVKAY